MNATRNGIVRCVAMAALLTISAGNSARASFILNIVQSGSNVIGTGSGTIDTDALVDMGETGGGGFIWGTYPVSRSAIGLSDPSALVEGFTGLIAGPPAFGSGPLFPASSGGGDPVDIAPVVSTNPMFGAIFVPVARPRIRSRLMSMSQAHRRRSPAPSG